MMSNIQALAGALALSAALVSPAAPAPDRKEKNPKDTLARTARVTCLLLMLLALPTAAQAQLNYTTNKGTIAITKYTGPGGAVTIPDSVTSIGNNAFAGCTSLSSITIPNNVTNIGRSAFRWCLSLTNVTIPNNVTDIGDGAFEACMYLKSITLPNRVISLGATSFANCMSLASITILANVTSSGSLTFDGCASLTNITLGKSVTNVRASAFIDCHTLTSITVDELNPAYRSLAGVLFNKDQTVLIRYPADKAGDYTIPGGVLSVANSAFESCIYLTGLTIPDSATNIGTYAFSGCIGLTKVTFGSSVTHIGNSAFETCMNLTNITFPPSVTSIGSCGFSGCLNLTNANIPQTVTNIGKSAFYYCPKLISLMVPNRVRSIGLEAFTVSDQTGARRKEKTLFEKKAGGLVLKVIKWEGSQGEDRAAREAQLKAAEARKEKGMAAWLWPDEDLVLRVLHYDLVVVSNGMTIGLVWQKTVQDNIGPKGMVYRNDPYAFPDPIMDLDERAFNYWCGVRDAYYDAQSRVAVVAFTDRLGRLIVEYVRNGGNNGRPVKPQHTGTVAGLLVKGTNAFADIRILPGPSDASLKVCVTRASGAIESVVWTGDGWKNEITPPKKEAPEKKP